MVIGTLVDTGRADKPLTRTDVESLLRKVGSTEKLSLRGQNLIEIDLHNFDLTGADLTRHYSCTCLEVGGSGANVTSGSKARKS